MLRRVSVLLLWTPSAFRLVCFSLSLTLSIAYLISSQLHLHHYAHASHPDPALRISCALDPEILDSLLCPGHKLRFGFLVLLSLFFHLFRAVKYWREMFVRFSILILSFCLTFSPVDSVPHVFPSSSLLWLAEPPRGLCIELQFISCWYLGRPIIFYMFVQSIRSCCMLSYISFRILWLVPPRSRSLWLA